jgi:hypothetical protein
VASISDINLTLPSSRALTLFVTDKNTYCELQIQHQKTTIHTYFVRKIPGLFRRIIMQITLGSVSAEQVENIKTDIESRYTYGEKIILSI